MEKVDRRIVGILQSDGRRTNVEVAESVGLSPSPCLRRIKRLERDGVILGYRAIVDREAVGLGLTVFAEIKVEKHSRANAQDMQHALAALPQVINCHIVLGVADFLAEIVVPDLKSYERLLTEKLLVLPMIAEIRSNFSLRQVKADAPLPFD